ncbi:MAG: MFS transporter [Bacteroidota bacterium]
MAPPKSIPLNDPKTINGWAMFDWANSAFALVITAAIFPGYFSEVTQGDTSNVLDFGWIKLENTAVFAYATSAAYLIITLLSPLLSGIADYGGKRKFFLRFFTTLGSLACFSLFFFNSIDSLTIGLIGYVLSMIGFAGGLVFYNSYLPEIVTEDRYDQVSAKGFAYGYIGSILLLCFNLFVIMKPEVFGLSTEGYLPVRIAFVTVGLWWIGFAQVAFARLPADSNEPAKGNIILKGFEELVKVGERVLQSSNIRTFLGAFFFISAGAQTVIFLAAIFASDELGFETTELITVILLLQIIGIGGAYFFAWLSKMKGNIFALITVSLIFIGICVAAYFVVAKPQFYIIAAFVGLVMGGVQSLSRATYSKLIPQGTADFASFFSFYDVLEKIAIVSGTFIFGAVNQLTGGMRNSVLTLSVFFLLSILLFSRVKITKSTAK